MKSGRLENRVNHGCTQGEQKGCKKFFKQLNRQFMGKPCAYRGQENTGEGYGKKCGEVDEANGVRNFFHGPDPAARPSGAIESRTGGSLTVRRLRLLALIVCGGEFVSWMLLARIM
jgi:hypothetical protein